MARGLFSGLIMGALVGGLGLAALSVAYRDVRPVAVPSDAPAPVTGVAAPGAEMPTQTSGREEAAPQAGPGPQAVVAAGEVPMAPEGAPGAELPPMQDAGATMPQVAVDAAPVEAPAGAAGEAAPVVRAGEAAPAISPPASGPASAPGSPVPEASPGSGPQPASPVVQSEIAAGAAPRPGEEPAMPGAEPAPDPAAAPAPRVPQAPEGSRPAAADTAPAAPVVPEPAGDGPPEAPAEAPVADPAPANGAPGEVPPAVPGRPAGQIGDIAENVVTGRLPSIGAAAPEAAPEAGPLPAIQRNAAPFPGSGGQPMMAVLLIDQGAARRDLGDLKNLPFQVSFLVDASAGDAAEAIDFYRGAGAEVVVQIPLPEWATPQDVETMMANYAPLMARAVAVMMPKEAGYQTLGDTAKQVAVVLSESGHGLITLPQGLNTGHKAALKQGVPAGLIFRELDNDGQSAAVMRRVLDNAAFKARQNKGGIMLGHARPETIQALIEWSLGNRAKSVVLAPISVVLRDR